MLLKEWVDIRLGYPFRGKIRESAGATQLAVQMKDTSAEQGISWASCTPVALEGKKAPGWLQLGDILLATRGASNYAALIESLPSDGLAAVATPHFYVLRPKQNSLMSAYLHWWLNQQPCQRHFSKQAEGTFTKSIRRAVLEAAPIVVPPMKEQQAVVKLSRALQQQNGLLNQQLNNNIALQTAVASDLLRKY